MSRRNLAWIAAAVVLVKVVSLTTPPLRAESKTRIRPSEEDHPKKTARGPSSKLGSLWLNIEGELQRVKKIALAEDRK